MAGAPLVDEPAITFSRPSHRNHSRHATVHQHQPTHKTEEESGRKAGQPVVEWRAQWSGVEWSGGAVGVAEAECPVWPLLLFSGASEAQQPLGCSDVGLDCSPVHS